MLEVIKFLNQDVLQVFDTLEVNCFVVNVIVDEVKLFAVSCVICQNGSNISLELSL